MRGVLIVRYVAQLLAACLTRNPCWQVATCLPDKDPFLTCLLACLKTSHP
jgi:hypothetical protein